jgi:hypothetical protein
MTLFVAVTALVAWLAFAGVCMVILMALAVMRGLRL